jgi:DNA polymerase-3 subunit chi
MSKFGEIRFYHLTRGTLEQALPDILGKALAKGHRIVLRAQDAAQTERLNDYLWTYHPNRFLPHGSKKDGNAALQPIWLTHEDDNPNNADVLIVAGNASDAGLEGYGLCCFMFDGHNEESLNTARARWKQYKEGGGAITYWQQTERSWQQKA